MKSYHRENPLFSLCGLNCGLCPMYHSDGSFVCPGCGGADFYPKHPTCAIVSCSLRHGNVEYCFQCSEFPCARYPAKSDYDSFISYQNVHRDFEKFQRVGAAAYNAELAQKMDILKDLLQHYNAGRQKSLFCTAVNLLELEDIQQVMAQIEHEAASEPDLKKRAATATRCFEQMGEARCLSLRLRKKKK